jgi:TatD DNase family protein
MTLIDTHTHLESFARDGSLDATLARAREAGVGAMITVGTSSEDWALYRDLAAAHRSVVHYSVGLHPCSVDANWASEVAQMEAFWKSGTGILSVGLAEHGQDARATPIPVALGECGLDRFHLPKDPAEAEIIFAWQRAAFAAQLALAKKLGCPLIVHSRGAFQESVEMIDASGVDWARVVYHCFSEGAAEIAELNRRGGRGSFTGILTYKKADDVRAAVKAQGLARLMVETDAPWLAPMPHRGKSNEPAFVRHTTEFAAKEIFGVSPDELAAVTTANAKAFFGI